MLRRLAGFQITPSAAWSGAPHWLLAGNFCDDRASEGAPSSAVFLGRFCVVTKIERRGVGGGGEMGGGIAEGRDRAGLDVIVCEVNEQAAQAGQERLAKSLDRAVSAGKLTEEERDAALSRLRFTTAVEDLKDRQIVIEAIVEDGKLKADLFAKLDKVVADPDAILASNTSSIPIAQLAGATGRPD